MTRSCLPLSFCVANRSGHFLINSNEDYAFLFQEHFALYILVILYKKLFILPFSCRMQTLKTDSALTENYKFLGIYLGNMLNTKKIDTYLY